MRWCLFAIFFVACAPPPPSVQTVFPTLDPDDTYNIRIANLRTTLGRAGVKVRLAGQETTFETEGCNAVSSESCTRCDLAGETTKTDSGAIEEATRAFALYPTNVLVVAQLEHVAICNDLYHTKGSVRKLGGYADVPSHGLLVSVKHFVDRRYNNRGELTVEGIAHHELYHLLEYAQMYDRVVDDSEWRDYNPISFVYAESNETAERREGFVNSYAMSRPTEDRASVYQFLMAHSDQLCELAKTDEVIRNKTRIIWRRVAAVAGTDSFMRAAAPCVDWLD